MAGRHSTPASGRLSVRVPERLSSRRTWWWPYLVIVVLAALLAGESSARGGFTAAVANTGDQARSGSLLTAAATGGTTECDLGSAAYNPIVDSNTASCSGDLTPALATGTGTSTLSTTVTDRGSLGATSASLVSGACGVVQLADTAAPADPLLVRGSTLSYAQTGPLTGGTALGVSGASAYAADVAGSAAPTANFTEAIWFKAPNASTTGGVLMGFTNTPSTTSPTSSDRMVWLDNTGHIVFGIKSTFNYEATTTAKYNDGAWHLAVATLNSATFGGGMSLYVDNAAAVTNTTPRNAGASTGYWHVGWDSTSGWTNAPTNPFFTGTLADAAIIPSVLSSTQVAALYTSGTQAAWASGLAALSPTHSWTLGDDGMTAYTGTVPSVTPAICDFVDIAVGASTTSSACAYPAGATACLPPTTTSKLSGLAGTTKSLTVFPTTTQTMTVTATIQRDTTTTVTTNTYAAGLHVTLPLTVSCASGGFSAKLLWAGQDMLL